MEMKPHKPDRNILVILGGHDFDASGFHRLLDRALWRDRGLSWTGVEFPAAEDLLRPELVRKYDAVLFYDMAGVDFSQEGAVFLHPPSAALMANMEALLEAGTPMLFLHHASGSWPKNERYAQIVGGCYLLERTMRGGRAVLESGFNGDVTHRLTPVIDHPIVEGLEEGFEIRDEVFMQHVYEDDIIPVMRSSYAATRDNFYSPLNYLKGKPNSNEGWHPADGSDVAVWIKREKNSPIVYIQPGHGPSAYDNPNYRRLLGNAVAWLTSAEAKAFARQGQKAPAG